MATHYFQHKTKIVFGTGAFQTVGEEIARLKVSRVTIITDSFLAGSVFCDQLCQQLKNNGIAYRVDSSVNVNPKDTDCDYSAKEACDFHTEAVIALGGGSTMDQAKAVCVLLTNGGSINDWENRELNHIMAPLICIPTTAGTGSEVTFVAVINNTKGKYKMSIIDPERMAPNVALCDPELTLTLPPKLTASTGMDALTHAVEAYTAKEHNSVSDALALYSIRMIFENVVRAYQSENLIHCRENMMMASCIAGMAFINSNVGAVHALAETVGAHYHLPHGLLNAVFLPYIVEFNQDVCARRYQEILRCIGKDEKQHLATVVRDLNRLLSIPMLSSILSLSTADLYLLAEKTAKNELSSSNGKNISKTDYVSILTHAYEDKQW